MTSNLTAEKNFLFVINITNEVFYHSPSELALFLKILPPKVRLYAIIHSGLKMVKVYCITNNYPDYELVAEIPDVKVEIINTKKSANQPTGLS